MIKKNIVRLSDAERAVCQDVIKKLKGTSQKVRRAHILLKANAEGEAKLTAMRLGKPPAGFGRWSLQLLADELVALEVVDSICAETVRQTQKKQNDEASNRVLGDPSGARY